MMPMPVERLSLSIEGRGSTVIWPLWSTVMLSTMSECFKANRQYIALKRIHTYHVLASMTIHKETINPLVSLIMSILLVFYLKVLPASPSAVSAVSFTLNYLQVRNLHNELKRLPK